MRRRIIGLHGKAGAGKGEVFLAIQGFGFTELYFAEKLYQMVSILTDRPVEWLKDRKNKDSLLPEIGVTVRRILQTLGTEWGRRMIRDDLWIFLAFRRLEQTEGPVAFTDVRFDDEAEAILAKGGEVWNVVRPGAATCEFHDSERGISPALISKTLVNDGTLADLHAEAVAMLKSDAQGHSSDRRKQGCAR